MSSAAKISVKTHNIYTFENYAHFHEDGSKCKSPWDTTHDLHGEPLGRRIPNCPHGLLLADHRAILRWREEVPNIVVTTGLNRLLNATLCGTNTGGAAGGYHHGGRMPTKWLVNTAYSVGDVVRPSGGSGQIDNNRIFICEVAGTSHATTEPTWTNTSGASVTDNTVTWREMSTWFVGLVDNASFSAYAAGDTMASHAGWVEGTPYSNTTRPQLTLGTVAAGSVDNSAAKAVFNINATLTVRGAFVCNLANKGTGTGTLYGAADFGASRSVLSGDTLNVQVTASVS